MLRRILIVFGLLFVAATAQASRTEAPNPAVPAVVKAEGEKGVQEAQYSRRRYVVRRRYVAPRRYYRPYRPVYRRYYRPYRRYY